MKSRFRIWALCVMMAVLGAAGIVVTRFDVAPVPQPALGEFTSNDDTEPLSHDDCQVLGIPAQLPAVVPQPGVRLVTPAKYRTTLMRTSIMRRSVNRLSCNIYAPLATTGQFVVERLTSPLREPRAVNYYVFTLCRLLC